MLFNRVDVDFRQFLDGSLMKVLSPFLIIIKVLAVIQTKPTEKKKKRSC